MTSDSSWDYSNSYEWLERARKGFGPVIIVCAVNGGIQGKEANPNLPETPYEIANQVYEAYNAGASAVHVHGRDPNNLAEAARDPEVYWEINMLIREKCPDIIINHTTGGGPNTTMQERYRCLDALPEMASLNMGPDMSRFKVAPRPAPLQHPHDGYTWDGCIPFTYGIVEGLAQAMIQRNIKPEMEMLHPGQYWVSQELIAKDLVKAPYVFQYVMGYQTSIFATPENLCALVRELPAGSMFFCLGVGPLQLPMTTMAILMGGHVRVGLEDNVYYSRGRKLTGNGEAVERVARIANELNREVASPQQARAMMGLSSTPKTYETPRSPTASRS